MDNPAGRLRWWLKQADSLPKNVSALDGWCQVFGLSQDDEANRLAVFTRGAELGRLAQQTREEMAQLPPELNADVIMGPFTQVEATLGQFTLLRQQKMEQFFAHLKPDGQHALKLADTFLSTHRREGWVEDATQADLLKQVRELIDQVSTSDEIDDATRRMAMERLHEVEQAILDVRLRGAGDVVRANDALLGAFVRSPRLWPSQVGQAIAALVVVVATALGMAADYKQLTDSGVPPLVEQKVVIITDAGGDDVIDGEVVDDLHSTRTPPVQEPAVD